jgi:predicted histone-like DNA-binding protein
MSVKYHIIARGKPADPSAPKKYYASVKSSGRVTVFDIAEEISRMSTVSSIDLVAMLEAFLVTIPQKLAEGKIVDLGEFGSFRLRVQSEGSDLPEEVSARNIKRAFARFSPGKRFRQVLRNITFQK